MPDELKEGSRITFEATFKDKATGAVRDISADTPILRYKYQGSAAVERTATVTDGPNGIAQYTMLANELVAGTMEFEWSLNVGGSLEFTGADVFSADIAPKLS